MKVTLTANAWQKLFAFVDQCEYEIGGLGKMTCDGVDFVVHDVEIFEQVVTATHVQMTGATLAKFQAEKVKKKESLKEYTFWWHSHAKMDAFFSGTDTDTIDTSRDFPYLLSLVTNHAHKLVCRLDVYSPVHLKTLDVRVELQSVEDARTRKACLAEIERKVTKPAPIEYKPYTPYVGGMGYGTGYKAPVQTLPTPYGSGHSGTTPRYKLIENLEERAQGLEKAYNDAVRKGKAKKADKLLNAIMEIDSQIEDLYQGSGYAK